VISNVKTRRVPGFLHLKQVLLKNQLMFNLKTNNHELKSKSNS
jgi:hypothetical protein